MIWSDLFMTNRRGKYKTVTDFIFESSKITADIIMHKCESWTTKKSEHRRIDAFKLWCWRRLLRVLWTAGRSNQSILMEINPECSLGGLVLNLQSFGHLMQGAELLEKTLKLVKIEGKRRRRWHKMICFMNITDSMDMNLGKLGERVEDRGA